MRPETKFLQSSGIALGARGEILVDEQLRTSAPDVFALGDAVAVTNIVSGKKQTIALASPANKQARIVADVVCGKPARYTGAQGTAIAKVFGAVVGVTGDVYKRQILYYPINQGSIRSVFTPIDHLFHFAVRDLHPRQQLPKKRSERRSQYSRADGFSDSVRQDYAAEHAQKSLIGDAACRSVTPAKQQINERDVYKRQV